MQPHLRANCASHRHIGFLCGWPFRGADGEDVLPVSSTSFARKNARLMQKQIEVESSTGIYHLSLGLSIRTRHELHHENSVRAQLAKSGRHGLPGCTWSLRRTFCCTAIAMPVSRVMFTRHRRDRGTCSARAIPNSKLAVAMLQKLTQCSIPQLPRTSPSTQRLVIPLYH